MDFVAALCSSAYGNLAQCMESIFTPREIETFSLPRIVAIGKRFSGKSSTLDAIVKIPVFPSNTMRPFVLKLSKGKHSITCDGKYFDTYEQVKEYIDDIMSRLIRVSEEELVVEICGPDLVNIEFCDPPGLSSHGDSELREKITRKYLGDDVIVLTTICSICVDRNKLRSTTLVRDLGLGHRNITVLTHADLVTQYRSPVEALLVDVGYPTVGVINRKSSQNYLDHHRSEHEWFANNLRGMGSSSELIMQLVKLVKTSIGSWIPRILPVLDSKIQEALAAEKSYDLRLPCRKDLDTWVNSVRKITNDYLATSNFALVKYNIERPSIDYNEFLHPEFLREAEYFACTAAIDGMTIEKRPNVDEIFTGKEWSRFARVKKIVSDTLAERWDVLLRRNLGTVRQFALDAFNRSSDHTVEMFHAGPTLSQFVLQFRRHILFKLDTEMHFTLDEFEESPEYLKEKRDAQELVWSLIKMKRDCRENW
jgi:hypothetical protein